MRQRVAITRAFSMDPSVIILDEAFGHLDEVTAHGLREDCLSLIKKEEKSAVVVTHNISEALDIGSRILVLGRPAKVLATFELDDDRGRDDWAFKKDGIRKEIFQTIESEPRIAPEPADQHV